MVKLFDKRRVRQPKQYIGYWGKKGFVQTDWDLGKRFLGKRAPRGVKRGNLELKFTKNGEYYIAKNGVKPKGLASSGNYAGRADMRRRFKADPKGIYFAYGWQKDKQGRPANRNLWHTPGASICFDGSEFKQGAK
jgi:hypothetical protein